MHLLLVACLLGAPTDVAAGGSMGELHRISTTVRGSIEASLVRKNRRHGPALAAQVARLIRWRGDVVHDVHPADAVTVLYEVAPEPQLVALRYRGSAIELEAFRHDDGRGIQRYFTRTGVLIEPGINNSPVADYVQITETVQGGSGKRRHKGLDLKAPEGTPIESPFPARVRRVNWSTRSNGKCVEVVYTDGTLKGKRGRFLHLHSIPKNIRVGATLIAGAPIGTVGNTGRSSAPHLHYEVRTQNGAALRPLVEHGTFKVHISRELQPAFDETVHLLVRRLEGDVPRN